jgi:hypothetical protein
LYLKSVYWTTSVHWINVVVQKLSTGQIWFIQDNFVQSNLVLIKFYPVDKYELLWTTGPWSSSENVLGVLLYNNYYFIESWLQYLGFVQNSFEISTKWCHIYCIN